MDSQLGPDDLNTNADSQLMIMLRVLLVITKHSVFESFNFNLLTAIRCLTSATQFYICLTTN